MSAKPNLVKNSLFSVIQIVTTSLCFVVIYYIIIKKLGKAELGAWSIITSLPTAISIFGSGVSGCILRYIPVYSAKNDEKSFNEIICNGLLFNLIFGGLIVLLGYLFSTPILQFLFSKKDFPIYYTDIFRLSLFTFYINFVSSVLLFAIDGLQLIHIRNKIMVIGSVSLCITAAIFIYFFNLKGVLFAQLFQSMLIALLSARIVMKNNLFHMKLFKVNREFFRLFLTYGQGFQAISLSVLLFDPITKYFLNKYFNLSVVGVYDLVCRIVVQTRTLIVSAIQVIVPMVSKSNEEGTLDMGNIYHRTSRGGSLLSFSLFSTLISFSMFAVHRLDPNHMSLFLYMSLFMAIAYHFNIIASTAYSILIGLGKLKEIIISHLLSTVINIILFLTLRNFLTDSLIVLPVSLSIILSSIYLIYAFRKKMKIVPIKIAPSDIRIISLAVITVVACILIVLLKVNAYFLLGLGLLHSIMMLAFMYYNDFFQILVRKILNIKS